jgi:hypothetical protein
MKKTFYFLAIIISGLSFGQSTDYGKFHIELIEPAAQSDLSWNNEDVKISYRPTDFFWTVKIENISNKKITVDWDKSTFVINKKSSGVVFDTTVKLLVNQPKGNEIIPANSMIEKKIYPQSYASEVNMYPLFFKRDIEKFGNYSVTINITTIKDQEEKDQSADFVVSLKKK